MPGVFGKQSLAWWLVVVPGLGMAYQGEPRPGERTKADIHPAFVITAEGAKKAMKRGIEQANKGRTRSDVLRRVEKTPRWFRGGKGPAQAWVWFTSIEGMPVESAAFDAASRYERPAESQWTEKGGMVHFADFRVVLMSLTQMVSTRVPVVMPPSGSGGQGGFWEGYRRGAATVEAMRAQRSGPPVVTKRADPDEVSVSRFLLSDGQGHVFDAEVGATTATDGSGTMGLSGVFALPVLMHGTHSYTGSITGSGAGAPFSATSQGHGQSAAVAVTYHPWATEQPYYLKAYDVRFSLFDTDGRPRFGPDVKELTLHIITASGELRAVYRLPRRSP